MIARARLVLASVALAATAAVTACILADPPPIQEIPPPSAPRIIGESVTPPLNEKLTALPLEFVVPVEADTDETLQWRVFIGDNVNATIGAAEDGGVLATDPNDAGTSVRVISFQAAALSLDVTQCTKITIVVAYDFGQSPSSPRNPPGGDQETWFYEPIPDCTLDDAAPPFDAAVSDAGLDGGSD